MSVSEEMSVPGTIEALSLEDYWVFDTAASNHTTGHKRYAVNVRPSECLTIGLAGEPVKAEYQMDFYLTACSRFGRELQDIKLTDVTYSEKHHFNLFRVARCLRSGWTISRGDSNGCVLTHTDTGAELNFDIVIPTRKGAVFAIIFRRRSEIAGAQIDPELTEAVRLSYKVAHSKLGHPDENLTRSGAKALHWNIIRGTAEVCESCARGKAKQKNIPKISTGEKATAYGGRFHHDITTIKGREGVVCTTPVMHCQLDEFSDEGEVWFYKRKDLMIEGYCTYLSDVERNGTVVKFIRMDNSGENKAFVNRAKSADWQLTFTPQFTSRSTPQQNSKVEVRIATLAGRARAMANAANFPLKERIRLAKYLLTKACDLDNLLVDKSGKSK